MTLENQNAVKIAKDEVTRELQSMSDRKKREPNRLKDFG